MSMTSADTPTTVTPGAAELPAQRRAVEAPGPGTWTIDASHVPHPMCGFVVDALVEPFTRGFGETFSRYGALLDQLAVAFVDGFMYQQPRPVGAPPGQAGPPPPREVWDGVVSQLPPVQERFAAAERALEGRLWREDLTRWDAEVKPALLRRQRELRAVDLTALDDSALADHVDACRELLREGIYQHHHHNAAAMLPVAMFLLTAGPLTGRSDSDLLGLLHGASPVSQGFPEELEALRAALADQPDAAAALQDPDADPATLLADLRRRPGALGQAARDYLDLIEDANVDGEDSVASPGGSEAPDLVLARVRAALAEAGPVDDGTRLLEEQVRAEVPADRVAHFDRALEEARRVYRLRDERSVYADKLAGALCRRALLEVGDRLQRRGLVREPENALDATAAEVRALLLDPAGDGPSADELAARTAWRRTASYRDMPPLFGPPPSPPLPADWLPPAAATIHTAFGVCLEMIIREPAARTTSSTVHGIGVSPGVCEGRAVLVHDVDDLRRVEAGDVLVATSTGPAFNLVLPLVAGIVTDRGGLLSHAAIVAREFGLPAVVGCSDATVVIQDGDRVRVDGAAGVVAVL